ncbi:Uncharacterised protein [Escherichia coli]|uniref:Uncharacterized protein n=1 Tax=Escherichia coli TaxID=562 RepID=A0A377HEY3_ECOLX|nr:Uncharacterised protein [Escherichia coli]
MGRLRINKIILITFDKRANELWRNQLSFMSKIRDTASQKVCTRTGFHYNN